MNKMNNSGQPMMSRRAYGMRQDGYGHERSGRDYQRHEQPMPPQHYQSEPRYSRQQEDHREECKDSFGNVECLFLSKQKLS